MHCLKLCLCFPLLLGACFASADQAAYIAEAQAEAAVQWLRPGSEVRHLCEPCDEKVPRAEKVTKTEVRYTGMESFYEVLLNGNPVDLAYLYAQVDGEWVNLAAHLGLDVAEVSLRLNAEGTAPVPDDSAGLPDFTRLHFAGAIGDKRVLLELWKSGAELWGHYQYLHIGAPLDLHGRITPAGELRLEESVAEDPTGMWEGALQADTRGLEGTWANLDGTRKLPFSLERIAFTAEETSTASLPGQACSTHLDYPVFASDSHPQAEALNRAVQGLVRNRHAEFMSQFSLGAIDLDLPFGFSEDSPMLQQELTLGEYQLALFSERFVSLLWAEYSYTGGAHGMTLFHALNLTPEGDKLAPVPLRALFADPAAGLKTLSEYLIADLKEQEAAWITDGQTTAFTFDELETFTVSAQGFTFYFEPYAVGPYAQGAFVTTVPFTEIAAHLKRERFPEWLLPKR